MAKTINGAIGFVSGTTATSDYIKQIFDGSTTHDIAVNSGITFFNGETEVTWDGRQPLEVVIPTVSDIVSSPVVFAGTVDSTGAITYATGFGPDAKRGYLVYITENCTFEQNACESGDMAVYDGTNWHVISGENQVSLNSSALALGKTAQSAITVEGQTLTLAIDYSDVRSNTKITTNNSNTLNVQNGTVTVEGKNIALSQASGSTVDITESVTISLPTALADGAVTINESVLEASNFVFTQGSYPTITKNSEAISVTASHNMTIAASGNGDFVTDVTAIKGVSFTPGSSASNNLAFVASLSTSDGASFVNGVHVKASDENATTDFTVWGQATVATSAFATGFSDASDSGDVVSSITIGEVSITNASDILTGLSLGGNSVVTSVSFGSLSVNPDASWFFSGLGDGSDVVTDVTVGAVTLISDSTSAFAGSAVTAASVSNHVLSFSTGSFMTPVGLSKAADTITKGGFTKSGVQLVNTSVATDTFTKGATLSQAASEISYKSLVIDNVTLTQSSTEYVFNKAASTAYSAEMGYVLLSVAGADVTKNGAVLENTSITATIPANSVAVDVTAGTLPTFTVNSATGKLTGSVGTTLTMSEKSWLAVDSAKKDIAVAGAYSLVEAAEGGIKVAVASAYGISNATVTIAEGTYVNGVKIDGTAVGVDTPVEP